MLKQAKYTGSMDVLHRTETAALVTARKITGSKVEVESYRLYTANDWEDVEVVKSNGSKYQCNSWNDTCDCDGRANGYECCHLRIIKALRRTPK